jgi:hypothetical protein
MQTLRFGLLIALLAGCRSPSAAAARWAGCYSLTRAAWDQVPESLLVELPGAALRLAADTTGYRRRFQGGPLPDSEHVHRTAWLGSLDALWWMTDEANIRVTTGGLAGVILDLRGTPADLHGTVTTFSDVLKADSAGQLQPWHSRAALEARRVECSSQPAS